VPRGSFGAANDRTELPERFAKKRASHIGVHEVSNDLGPGKPIRSNRTAVSFRRADRPVIVLGRGTLEERWTVVNGWRMFARVSDRAPHGNSPPVVLVHGLGVSSRYMVPLAVNLARSFRVYAPDLPGFGRSDRPKRALSVRELAAALRAWLNDAGILRALVVGNSMGCQIMVELAELWPDLMCAAVLLGPTMDGTARHGFSHVWRLFKDQFREPALLIPLQAFDYLTNGPLRTIQTFREALRHDMLGRIHLIRAPTVIMRGEQDEIVSRTWVEKLAARLPSGTLIEVPRAGHALNYNAPASVGDVVRKLSPPACEA
jgi:2-hydroxy-6-oxonona-2,4-dienedioate hydrolase